MADAAVSLESQPPLDEASQLPEVGVAPSLAPEQVVAEVGGEVAEEEPDYNEIFELGDFVRIDSTKYGKVIGYIYYRDGELISVMPLGATDFLYDFPRIFDDENDKFDDDLGVSQSFIFEKRKLPTFVEQQDFHVGQVIETIKEDRQRGQLIKITNINTEDDTITVEDQEGNSQTYEFAYTGIPRDAEFKILRIVEQPKDHVAVNQEVAVPEQVEAEESPEGEVELDEEDEIDLATQQANKNKFFDIEVVGEVTVKKAAVFREARSSEKTYTDTIQKADAMSDFLNLLDPVAQKDPKQVRSVRMLVETLFSMKQETVKYNEDGSVAGEQKLSVNLLKDLLSSANVPLSRPVLDIALRIFLKDDELTNFQLKQSNEFYRADASIQTLDGFSQDSVNPVVSGAANTNIFRTAQKNFIKEFETIWKPNGLQQPLFYAKEDSEFFRFEIPSQDNETLNGLQVTGITKKTLEKGGDASELKGVASMDVITNSVRRAATTTFYKHPIRRKEQLVSAETAPVKAHVLFPIDTAATVGSKRSGLLAIDSARSHDKTRLMKDILEEKNGVIILGKEKESEDESATVDKILALDMTGNEPSTFLLKDYLEGMNLPATGLGDMQIHLEDLGLNKFEFTPDIFNVLDSKIKAYQNQLLASLARFREVLASSPEVVPEDNSLLDKPDILEKNIRSEPILVQSIEALQIQTPGIEPSDLAIVSFLLKKHTDYFQVAMGQQAYFVAREKYQATRDRYLAAIYIRKLLDKKKKEAGIPPKPNKCEHVAKLAAVRKIEDDQERIQALAKLFSIYQGETKDKFINCNVCKRELLCMHEKLQISAFLNPGDNQNIQKEIILQFGGGQFQGTYACRNCGQAIQEIDYDTHLEYDDDGKPMNGRAVLVDKDAILEEQLENALKGVPIRKAKDIKFKSDTEENYRDIIFELGNRVGISLSESTIRKIVERLVRYAKSLPSQADYEKQKAAAPGKSDYIVIINKRIIAAAAVLILLEVQTNLTPYQIRYSLIGCEPSFEGYPLDRDKSDTSGLKYLACAVASIPRREAPWNLTGWQDEPDAAKRTDNIYNYMVAVIQRIFYTNPVIDQEIMMKRAYLETKAQQIAEARKQEVIPEGFLPAFESEEVLVPEVAARMTNGGPQIAKAWIRGANSLAERTAVIVRGSPIALTTCCLGSITTPGAFWLSASDLPELEKRRMKPNYRVQSLWVHFKPRPLASIAVEHDDNLNYRLFLKVCHQGPNKGLLHEVGLTNQCRWCEFAFPANPAVVDADSETSDGKVAVTSQGIDTSREAFEDLLDTVHMNNKVQPYKVHTSQNLDTVMTDFIEITPPPFDNWREVMTQTVNDLKLAVQSGKKSDLENAIGEISKIAGTSKARIEMRMPTFKNQIAKLGELSWDNLLSTLLAYFIVPFRRILTEFEVESYRSAFNTKRGWSSYSNLGLNHLQDLTKILDSDQTIVKEFKGKLKDKEKYQAAYLKLENFVEAASAIIAFKERIHPGIFPGREYSLKWIQKAIVFSLINTLVDPTVFVATPSGGAADQQGISTQILMELVAKSLTKFNSEQISYNDDQLRELIMIRNEKEKADVISNMFDKRSPEEKAVEIVKKQLGIGRWAVGGTKAIWGYDIDQYEREREDRARAGIIDFPGYGPDQVPELAGRQLDANGYPVHGAEGGYDFTQTGEDDA